MKWHVKKRWSEDADLKEELEDRVEWKPFPYDKEIAVYWDVDGHRLKSKSKFYLRDKRPREHKTLEGDELELVGAPSFMAWAEL